MFLYNEQVSIKVKKTTILNFILILIYKVIIDVCYFLIIARVWGYEGFNLDLNNFKLVESYILLIVVFAFMPKLSKKLSSIFIYLMILLSYVPILTLFYFMDQPRSFVYAIALFWVLVFILLKIPGLYVPPIKNSQSSSIYYMIFIFLSVSTSLLIFKYIGITYNLSLSNIYEVRSYYIGLNIPFAGYLFDWSANILNPIFFAYFLTKRKWVPVIAIILIQLLLFSSTGIKSFLFALPFVLSIMWIVRRKNVFMWMTIGLCSMVLIGMLSFYIFNDVLISALFARRILFVPAQLAFLYFDFFYHNGPTFLSQHHLFGNIIAYPYQLSPPYLIGEVYFKDSKMGANNGIYADAFMNFGFAGFIMWAFLLAFILKLYDSLSKNKNILVTIAAIATPSLSLVNSALLTSLISHGIVASLVVLYLLPKENK